MVFAFCSCGNNEETEQLKSIMKEAPIEKLPSLPTYGISAKNFIDTKHLCEVMYEMEVPVMR